MAECAGPRICTAETVRLEEVWNSDVPRKDRSHDTPVTFETGDAWVFGQECAVHQKITCCATQDRYARSLMRYRS